MKELIVNLSQSYYFTTYAIFAASASIVVTTVIFLFFRLISKLIFRSNRRVDNYMIVLSFSIAVCTISSGVLYQQYIKSDEDFAKTIRLYDVHKESLSSVDRRLIKNPYQFDQLVTVAIISDLEGKFEDQQISIRSAQSSPDQKIVTTIGNLEFRVDKQIIDKLLTEGENTK